MYSATDGLANDWHSVHLGSRATGGAGLIIVEATAVEARGRITPRDLGLWSDDQIAPLARIVDFMESQGAVAGIQIAHAGRKASCYWPWAGKAGEVPASEGGWETVAPSAIRFRDDYPLPHELTVDEIHQVQAAFVAGAQRARAAGFRWLELHAAHGYLMHSFYSPYSNHRTDAYGGSFENRIRFLMETTQQVRAVWPEDLPLTVRISATDWLGDAGWQVEDSVELARHLKAAGVDLVDCSSGGISANARIATAAGYQVPMSQVVRREAGIATATVGLITQPEQAEEIIRDEQADVVLIARESLRDAYWPIHAAIKLGQSVEGMLPPQYARSLENR
jgi:2,4-dienoyl-CoA reductase-like NADH-dependent reductase (Old Yellow Enzyme family)